MSKFLRINTNQMMYLKEKAMPNMVFGCPNDVLRSILGLESKKKSKQSTGAKRVMKIRIDDEVLEQLKTRAKQLDINYEEHLDKLLEKILKGRRPPTRRG